ncbi:hypothetical protein JCM3770_003158 [Rhodotorula araucariae]
MDGSFVLVSPDPDAHPPAALAAFFPRAPDAPLLDPAQLALIHAARDRQPDARLFIDHLLHLALGHPAPVHFPPTSHPDLALVVARLAAASHSGQLVARSCLYYLALVFSGPTTANALARHLVLPAAFRLATRALHALDTANYRHALRLVADPRVDPDFVPRTLAVLATVPEPASDRAELVLSYWRLARIDLSRYAKDDLKHVLRALCAPERPRGVQEAWTLARDWHIDADRDDLARTVLATCFGDNHTGRPLASHLSALMVLPLTPTEDVLATSFCALPPAPLALSLTVDWRLSKLIAESRPVDALRFFARAQRDHPARLAQSDARDRLLKAVEANLTDVQRAELALALALAAPAPAPASAPAQPPAARITQPAWAWAPTAAAGPAPASQQPGAADLPLSASAFVRAPVPGQGGQASVLRALEAAQTQTQTQTQTPRRPAVAAAPGSPFARPVAGAALVAAPASPAAAPKEQQRKPTLQGFGSVRQAALTASVLGSPAARQKAAAAARAPRHDDYDNDNNKDSDDDGDGDGDAAMRSPSRGAENDKIETEADDEPFGARATRDPAIARTLAAAAAARGPPQTRTGTGTPRRSHGGVPAGGEASKRRAVHRSAPREGEVDPVRSTRRAVVPRAPPPGAFPASEDDQGDDDDDGGEGEEEGAAAGAGAGAGQGAGAGATAAPVAAAGATRRHHHTSERTAQAAAHTPARRRSARASVSRAGTAEPPAPSASAPAPADSDSPASTTTAGRRATRASSATPAHAHAPAPVEAAAKTPVRRSSRLSGLGGTATATATATAAEGSGTARNKTRTGVKRRGRGPGERARIQEESAEE